MGSSLVQAVIQEPGNVDLVRYNEHELQSALSPSLLDKEPSLIGRGHNTDVGSSFIQAFTQEPGSIDLVEYHTNKDKEPRSLGRGPKTDVGSSLIRTTTQNSNRPNSATYSDHIGHNTVKIQNVLPL